ncbi:hypothetical protein M9H77_25595 [Catharanthus roseus]|uniref:Uncharacterized protein n=1 Tax=Catharanthus roseus TaxID=4058 RepID=A0ACC0A7B7_CATRO|nr:hypothetical protein M9H77_25595 [Catharanthus roseus]
MVEYLSSRSVYRSVRGLHCTWVDTRTRAFFDDVDSFRLRRVDPFKEGHSTVEGLAQSDYVDTALCSAVGRPPYGSQERLETKVGLRVDLVAFEEAVITLNQTLENYEQLSGQVVNLQKSTITFGRGIDSIT